MMTRSARLLLLALLVGAVPLTAQPTMPAVAETLAELATKAREARLRGDVPVWREYAARTLALTPDHPDILVSAARANAAAGDRARAIAYLAEAARRGAGLDPPRFAEFKALAGDPAFEAAVAAARRNLTPVARSAVFAELGERDSEGIAFDPVSRRFFGGADESGLFAVGMDGKVVPFAKGGGLRQTLGLKVDAGRRLLWVVNGRYPDATYTDANRPADAGTGGVRAYHLDTGALVTAVEVDERPALVHGFNDMALADDGTVYVTDTNTSAVYKLASGSKTLELVLRDAGMTFPNGIVMAADGRTLYVAHVEGISALDPATKARTLLPVPAAGSVHSIDGLLLHEGVLYGVQNSPYMQRIVGAVLAADGRSITRVWPVNARDPANHVQSTSAIAGDQLYVIGGSPAPDLYGGSNPAEPMRRIWRVPLKT